MSEIRAPIPPFLRGITKYFWGLVFFNAPVKRFILTLDGKVINNYFTCCVLFPFICRAVVSTGSTGSIEPVDFWRRHNGTCEIAKAMRIDSVKF